MEDFCIDYSYFINSRSSARQSFLPILSVELDESTPTKPIYLSEGVPNEAIFPFDQVNVALKDGINYCLKGKELGEALQYVPSKGYPPLLAILKDFTRQIHQPPNWSQRELLVTVGSQDAISKSLEMILEEGDPVLSQCPLYSGLAVVVQSLRSTIIAIDQDEHGMIPHLLRETLHQCERECLNVESKMPKILYVNPTGSNPAGTTMTLERRQDIYGICCDYNILILEDDPYCFMNYADTTPPSFLSLDIQGRVIRIDSLSKIICPGLRIGWVTAAKPFIEVLDLSVENCYLNSSSLSQVVIYNLLNMWKFEKTLEYFKSVRDHYRERRDIALRAMNEHLTGLCDWNIPKGGLFLWIKVRDIPDVHDMIMTRAIRKCISLAPGHGFMANSTKACNFIRVSFGRESPAQIVRGIKLLADVIRDEKALLVPSEGTA